MEPQKDGEDIVQQKHGTVFLLQMLQDLLRVQMSEQNNSG
jgi:hypothetical protein